MTNKKYSVDGFILRGTRNELGTNSGLKQAPAARSGRLLHTGDSKPKATVGTARSDMNIGRRDIDDTLRGIDNELPVDGKKPNNKRLRGGKKDKKPKSKVRRIIFWVVIGIVAAILAVIGYLAYHAATASNGVFKGSIIDLVQNEPLKKDANGRSNFLVFGTESEGHPGADLTDSIMVLSVDQEKKDAYMVSLPRDLWVEYNETCTVGNQGKLNAVYFCASNDGENEAEGAQALSAKAGEITGLDIQYYIHMNWAALIQSVDAVGGVDVTINSSDPRGILDRNFDWVCNYKCYYVNYKNGETVHMDGEHALAFSRARNASGGYGLPNGNFDREKNQQLVIKAFREKAVSAGTLTNIGAITGLLDALGDNFRTNIETKEIRTLMDIGTKIPSDKIISLSLNEEGSSLVTTGSYNSQSIVRPVAGLLDYSEIAKYINREMTSEPYMKEEPRVAVLNGSGTAGVAQTTAADLEDKGFIVESVDNAPDGTYGDVEIYQINAQKTATAAKLKELYGVTLKTTAPPVSVTGETDFVIIIGKAPPSGQ